MNYPLAGTILSLAGGRHFDEPSSGAITSSAERPVHRRPAFGRDARS